MDLEKNHVYHMDGMKAIEQYRGNRNVIIVTDPPFNIGYKYGTYVDRKSDDEYLHMLATIIENFPTVMIHYPEALYSLTART